MIRQALKCILVLGLLANPLCGQTITWNSDANAVNQTSNGSVMDAGFRFELGVFIGGFVPTSSNTDQWAQNWRSPQQVNYDAIAKRFTGTYTRTNNDSPYLKGKATYVWGFKGDGNASEWILFRASSWLLPDFDPQPPSPSQNQWYAKDATAIIGDINRSGSPFLMKTVEIQSYSEWQTQYLIGEPLNGPNDDPDQDGVPNLLEFIFGTPPKSAGSPVPTPVSWVENGGQTFLQMTIPRRIGHRATLVVEVSSDLVTWNSGDTYTEIVSNNTAVLIVRDKTPLSGNLGKRFMRLRATLP